MKHSQTTFSRAIAIYMVASMSLACSEGGRPPQAIDSFDGSMQSHAGVNPASATSDASPSSLDAGASQHTDGTPVASTNPVVSATMPEFVSTVAKPFIRVDLQATLDGKVVVQRASTVNLTIRPLPSLDADYLLVAYDAMGQPLSAMPVRFSWVARTSERVQDALMHKEIALQIANATVYLEAINVQRLVLLAPDSTVVATVERDAIAKPLPAVIDRVSSIKQGLSAADFAVRYPHITIAKSGDTTFNPALLEGQPIIDADEAALDVIAGGLAKVAPAVIGAVSRIALVNIPRTSDNKRRRGIAAGSELVIEAADVVAHKDDVEATIVHETAHNFVALCGGAQTTPDRSAKPWSPDLVNMTSAMLAKFHLLIGLKTVWQRLHATGVAHQLASAYTAEGANDEDPTNDRPNGSAWLAVDEPGQGGFASAYGSSNASEDIAEYVASTQRATWLKPGICPVFLNKSTVEAETAIPYAKLTLLRGIGAITEANFDRCVGSVSLGRTNPGIHFEGTTASFGDDVAAGVTSDESGPLLRVRGRGPKSYGFVLEVRLKAPRDTPLGLHRVDDLLAGAFKISLPSSAALYLANDDSFLARVGSGGLVLVTESSEQRVEGALFGVELQNPLGVVTDKWPFGRFAVDL